MSNRDDLPQPPEMPCDFAVSCEVVLTPQQRAIVKAETGRDMDVLILADSDGLYTQRMTESTPEDYTVLAIKQARILNDYDAQYHDYLVALAAWQASLNEPDPDEALLESISVKTAQDAERIKLFYMQEVEACKAAREVAKIAFGKKG